MKRIIPSCLILWTVIFSLCFMSCSNINTNKLQTPEPIDVKAMEESKKAIISFFNSNKQDFIKLVEYLINRKEIDILLTPNQIVAGDHPDKYHETTIDTEIYDFIKKLWFDYDLSTIRKCSTETDGCILIYSGGMQGESIGLVYYFGDGIHPYTYTEEPLSDGFNIIEG